MAGTARSVLLSVFALFMFSACSSSSPVRYFSLNPIDAEFRPDPDDAVMLGLGPVRMPGLPQSLPDRDTRRRRGDAG